MKKVFLTLLFLVLLNGSALAIESGVTTYSEDGKFGLGQFFYPCNDFLLGFRDFHGLGVGLVHFGCCVLRYILFRL